MASTYRDMAYSVLEQLKQISDDSDVQIPQIIYLIQLVTNRVMYLHIKKSKSNAYLVYFPDVPLKIDSKTGRKYTILPGKIIDLDYDKGINTVSYCTDMLSTCDEPLRAPFVRTSPNMVRTLYGDPFRKPSPSNVLFFRSKIQENGVGEFKDAIIYLGLECIDVNCVDMYIYLSIEAGHICNLDEEIGLNAEQELVVYYEVLNLARYGFLIPADRQNNGTDDVNLQSVKALPKAQPYSSQELQDAQQQQQ